MKKQSKYIFLAALFLLVSSISFAIDITDNIQAHGFLTQGAFYTSANNYNGPSEDSVSFQQTEIGLNLLWQADDRISFSAQGLSRRAGDLDGGSIQLDYGLMDVNLFNNENSQYGLRLGRIKNPMGLYNETRDMAFTTPSILLPQSLYLERSRTLFLSSDGVQAYAESQLGIGAISIKVNYGLLENDNDEIQKLMFGSMAQGSLKSDKAIFLGQIRYNIESDKYVFAVSYVNNATLNYKPETYDFLNDGSASFSPLVFSAQYNDEKISLTGEYYYSQNEFKDFGPYYPDNSPITTNWYLQGAYRFNYSWQATLRYDVNYLDRDNRSGSNFELMGRPSHLGFTKDWMIGLRWDIDPQMMLRAEYHYLNGTSWISAADNSNVHETEQYWDMFALQFSYRF